MRFHTLLAPAALVALVNAQFYDDLFDNELVAREAPGYDDLGFFLARDVDQDFGLKTRDAEPEALDEEEYITALMARDPEAFEDFAVLLLERDAEAEADPEANPEPKKRKHKKGRKGKKKGKKHRYVLLWHVNSQLTIERKHRKHRKNRKNRKHRNR
jgi:hypothetical protein